MAADEHRPEAQARPGEDIRGHEPPALPALPELDVIDLCGVTAWGHHGVLPHEQEIGQQFSIDARLHLDTRAAGHADALGRTVNYAEVAEAIVQTITGTRYDLLEALAADIASRVLSAHVQIRRLELVIHKPGAPIPHPFADVRLRITRDAEPVTAVLALGTNMGEREEHLRTALAQLRAADGVEVLATAPVVETAPVGGVEQGAFLNSAVLIRTALGPWTLLDLAQRLERSALRERLVRWGPRTLDVDLIAYGDLQLDDPDLTLPHPRAHERAFVLQPWQAIQPEAELPEHGPISALLEQAEDRDGLRSGPDIAGFGAP